MAFSFRYRSLAPIQELFASRPLVPIRFRFKDKSIASFGLVDSGADYTILPKNIAEVLNLKLGEKNITYGLGGSKFEIALSKVIIEIGKCHEQYSFEIPVQVFLADVEEEYEPPIILGRIGFFDRFEITFAEKERKIRFKRISPRRTY